MQPKDFAQEEVGKYTEQYDKMQNHVTHFYDRIQAIMQ